MRSARAPLTPPRDCSCCVASLVAVVAVVNGVRVIDYSNNPPPLAVNGRSLVGVGSGTEGGEAQTRQYYSLCATSRVGGLGGAYTHSNILLRCGLYRFFRFSHPPYSPTKQTLLDIQNERSQNLGGGTSRIRGCACTSKRLWCRCGSTTDNF